MGVGLALIQVRGGLGGTYYRWGHVEQEPSVCPGGPAGWERPPVNRKAASWMPGRGSCLGPWVRFPVGHL